MNLQLTGILTLIFFGLIFILELYGVHGEHNKLRKITKPLIMPLICLFYISGTPAVSPWVIAAMAGGWLGDIFLMYDGTKCFIAGLLSFLAGHLLYILVFVGLAGNFAPVPLWYWTLLVPFALFLTAAFFILKDKAGALLGPAMAYAAVLLTMVFTAGASFFTAGTTAGSWALLAGALLFLASDSMLGLRKFIGLFSENTILVMLTYMPAQFLIAAGLLIL